MKPFDPYPQCVECLIGLAQSMASLVDEGDLALQEQTVAKAVNILETNRNNALSSPQIANRILRELQHLSGIDDPYARFKALEMELARGIFSRIQEQVGPDLGSCISSAVLGNSLDFFKDPEKALEEIPQEMADGLTFFYDDADRLEALLSQSPGLVLYLTDNAGEIYFDLPLYDYIRARAQRTVLVVKGGPSLNDLTRAELQRAGLENRFQEVADTGTDGAGVDWDHVSPAFMDLMGAADLIVSKGMANFETLYPKGPPSAAFFLFRVKCRPIQNYLSAPMGSFLALWQDVEPG
jgi:uncharacterized protein with ATP-grasp and redox domains